MRTVKYEIGDTAYLKVPERGYRHVEIVDYNCVKLVVRVESGMEFTVYPNELED